MQFGFFRFKSRNQHETITHLKAFSRTVGVRIGVGFLSAYLEADMGTYPEMHALTTHLVSSLSEHMLYMDTCIMRSPTQ